MECARSGVPHHQAGVTEMTTPRDSDSDCLERIERLVEQIINVLEKVVNDVEEIKTEQATMKTDIAVLQRDMGVMKGWQTELVVERRARAVFRRLCGGHLLRIYPDMELQHYIGHNRQAGKLTEDEFVRAGNVDFLLEGTDYDGVAVIYAVEVSYTMGLDDSDRAIDKAGLLTVTLDREVRPAVVGESCTAQFEADAARRNVAYAYIGNGRGITR